MMQITRHDPIHTRALISVQIDHRQYRALMSMAQQATADDMLSAAHHYRQAALDLRRQAQMVAWVLTGQWPARTAQAVTAQTGGA